MEVAEVYTDGFEELEKMLSDFSKESENVVDLLVIGAKALVDDVRKLPRPRSAIKKSGHTHLLDTVTYSRKKDEVETGWGKYYGPMVERGTRKMAGTPHFSTTFEANKEKYYKLMTKDLYEGGK